METQVPHSLETFVKNVPHSGMVYPQKLQDRLKYYVWKVYTPCHPYVRDTALWLRIISHDSRQDFVLGRVAPHLSMEEFISFLISKGFKNHFVAWKDPGELVSLRYAENFVYQYHLRIFQDGEVRGHYEYTPECRPILHMREIGLEDRRHEFFRVLGDRVVSAQV